MKKQLLLTLMMLCVAASSFAVEVEIGGIWYEVISKAKEAKVIRYKIYNNQYSGNIVIPETVKYEGDVYCVTSIGERAFSGCSGLTSVTIPNSVTSIGSHAFSECRGLTSVNIPDGVKSIGDCAFQNCSGLTSVNIPNSVPSIGAGTFYGCSSLASMNIPNSVTSIGNSAFNSCSGLTSVNIPNSVTSIGNSAFSGCSSLTSVNIPNSVPSIGERAFSGCSSLASMTIPNSVTSIGNSAFNSCSGLTSVNIPNSVTSIGNSAFSGCSGLPSISIPNSVATVGESAFEDCSSLTSISIPNSVTTIKASTFKNCSSLTSISIPNSVTTIGGSAFESCTNITSISIGNSVTSIGERTFYCCSNLNSITIPNSVTSIGEYTFYGCTSLSSVIIPTNVTNIRRSTFEVCSCLTSITIPNRVTTIERNAFYYCTNLKSVDFGKNVTDIGESAFQGCSNLTSIIIPNSVTSIGRSAFAYCEGLTDVYCFAANVPNTKGDAFKASYIEYATLHVPSTSIVAYTSSDPWKNFNTIVAVDEDTPGGDTPTAPKCATPIISYKNGCLTFSCETEGVEFISEISNTDIKKSYDATIPLSVTYIISVYATKAGCDNSDISTATFSWMGAEPMINGETAKYRLSFVVDNNELSASNVEYGATVTPPATDSEGNPVTWYTYPTTMPAHDLVVYGMVPKPEAAAKYTITYVLDGQTYRTIIVEEGASVSKEKAPYKEGYTFNGWQNEPTTMPGHDVTVNGTFNVNTYHLSFIVDNEELETKNVEYGAAITVPTKDSEGNNITWYTYPATMPAHDLVVYGMVPKPEAAAKYTITYVLDGQTYRTIIVEEGASVSKEKAPYKEGYTFNGWQNEPTTMPGHDVTVNGTFNVNTYHLSFIVDNEELETKNVEYGAAITVPTKDSEGNNITWYTHPMTMPAHDLVVYGMVVKEPEPEVFVWLTIKDGQGTTKMKVKQGLEQVLTIMPEEGWKILSVAMDGTDVTALVMNGGSFTTPAINSDASIIIVYEQEAPSGVRATQSQTNVKVVSDGVVISNAEPETRCIIYSTDGQQVVNTVISEGTRKITLQQGQVYILTIEGRTLKFAL